MSNILSLTLGYREMQTKSTFDESSKVRDVIDYIRQRFSVVGSANDSIMHNGRRVDFTDFDITLKEASVRDGDNVTIGIAKAVVHESVEVKEEAKPEAKPEYVPERRKGVEPAELNDGVVEPTVEEKPKKEKESSSKQSTVTKKKIKR